MDRHSGQALVSFHALCLRWLCLHMFLTFSPLFSIISSPPHFEHTPALHTLSFSCAHGIAFCIKPFILYSLFGLLSFLLTFSFNLTAAGHVVSSHRPQLACWASDSAPVSTTAALWDLWLGLPGVIYRRWKSIVRK